MLADRVAELIQKTETRPLFLDLKEFQLKYCVHCHFYIAPRVLKLKIENFSVVTDKC